MPSESVGLYNSFLFHAWCYEGQEYRAAYQILAALKFNLFRGISSDELVEGLKRSKNFENFNLSHLKLNNADLSYANLKRVDLTYTELRGANLSNADLKGADLSRANLQDADLKGADLSSANLQDANLKGAMLIEADLKGSSMKGADVSGVKITYSDYSNIVYFVLPDHCDDNKLIEAYKSCTNPSRKIVLKGVLEAKEIPIE